MATSENLKHTIQHIVHDACDKIPKQVAKEIKREVEGKYKQVIDKWYADYDRKSYRPKERLYDAFYVKVYGPRVSFIFTDSLFSYNGWEEYIFDLTIMDGWHGGAIDGDGHPDPETPWYNNPRFNHTGNIIWLDEAAQSFSPYEAMAEYINVRGSEWKQDIEDRIVDYVIQHLKGVVK